MAAGRATPDCPESEALRIEVAPESPRRTCTGEAVTLALLAEGGAPPYVWSSAGLEGFDLKAASGASERSLEITGSFEDAGVHEITVSVRAGEGAGCLTSSRRFVFDVGAAPAIDTAGLEDACVGEPYAASLTASSAAEAMASWAIAGALPGGLRLEGDQITGVPTESGTFGVVVQLESKSCVPTRRSLELTVHQEGDCPRIEPRVLAAPCVGLPYSQALSVINGQPPYRLALLDAPSWLSLDADTLSSSGVPAGGSGQVATLEVVDAGGRRRQQRYVLSPRESCHFAYVSENGEAPGLHYADVLGSRDVLVARWAPDEPAPDFEFSPDGRLLAFRTGASDARTVSLYSTAGNVPGPPQGARRVPFACPAPAGAAAEADCSVLDYAWSSDSSYLAVVLGAPGLPENYLSGVAARAPDRPWGTASAQYRQRLAWVGSSALVFSGGRPELPDRQYPSFSLLRPSEGALSAPASASVPASAWALRPTPTGAFFFDGNLGLLHFSILPQPEIQAHAAGWLSPSGRYAAAANDEGRLQISAVGDPSVILAESAPGECEVVFAWAERREVIACTRSLSSVSGQPQQPQLIGALPFSHGSRLRIFEFDPSAIGANRLSGQVVPPERYFEVATAGRRRTFSPDGRWLVFLGADAAGEEMLQGIMTGPTASGFYASSVESGSLELGVAPTGDSLVTYAASISLRTPPDRETRSVSVNTAVPINAAPPEVCAEEFHSSPERWCGSPSVPNRFRFSPDGKALLLEDAGGRLWSVDVSGDAPSARPTPAALPRCGPDCTKRPYAFRPTPNGDD